ncbi:MAG: group II intron reverse transcriptase/maturase [Gemmatimonadota bacterium]|nr:group II intron reverse transcriptase/maturase [Gemmatimonadota bacterium]
MTEADADKKAERPDRNRGGSGGTARDPKSGHQTDTARNGMTDWQAAMVMEEVVSRENMLNAYRRVVQNKGAAGVDGVSVDGLGRQLCARWSQVREALLEGSYQPDAVRKVEIPKPGGRGTRILGVPTVMDRLVQQALLQVLQPHIDPTFSELSFGFRPRRSAHQAIQQARSFVAAGYRWVVDIDLEKCFDRINHDVLMSRVARRVGDKRILHVIRRFLQAGMMAGGVVSPRGEGTPQGGPLSPLLSNILLDEWDRELERRGHAFVRYADDCNIYVGSKQAGERVLASIQRFVHTRLKLKVNREKSAVARPWKRTFLGYSMTHHRQPKLRVAPESVKRLREKLRTTLQAGRGKRLEATIAAITPLLQGWMAYFRLAQVKACFEELDHWIRRRMRRILWKQWKRPRTRAKQLIARGIDRERARRSAYNGRGPWWNAGASHMNQAVPIQYLSQLGLVSLLQKHLNLDGSS